MTAAKPARLIQPYMPADAKLVIGAVRISAEMMTVVALFFRKPNHTAIREVQAANSEIQMLQISRCAPLDIRNSPGSPPPKRETKTAARTDSILEAKADPAVNRKLTADFEANIRLRSTG